MDVAYLFTKASYMIERMKRIKLKARFSRLDYEGMNRKTP